MSPRTPVTNKRRLRSARIFEFVDLSGCELHTINDPEDQLPIPVQGQKITLGSDRMWVDTYYVRVQRAAKA